MTTLRERHRARLEAAEMGLPWPSNGPVRDLLLDALETGGYIHLDLPTWHQNRRWIAEKSQSWQVADVVDCSCCAGVVRLRYDVCGGGGSIEGVHVPTEASVEPA